MPKGVYKRTEEHKRKIGLANKGNVSWNKGKKRKPEVIAKIRAGNIGKKRSQKFKDTMSMWGKIHCGSKCNNWKGGTTRKSKIIRSSNKYKLFRMICLSRDNFTCKCCGYNGGKLNVHHINNFADFKELRFDVENGVTLCQKCHNLFHKEYGKRFNTREQLINFAQKYESFQ